MAIYSRYRLNANIHADFQATMARIVYPRASSSASNLTRTKNNPLLTGQPFKTNRAARVNLVGRDSDLGAEPILKTIRKTRRGVDHH
jgi:hypothetical protein